MDDEIARRREARRRKILENSQNRLQKITGIEQKTTRVPEIPSCENHAIENTHTDEFLSDLSNNREKEVQPKLNKFEPAKNYQKIKLLVIIGLGVFVNYLLLILEFVFKVDVKASHLNKIFVPILLYEVLEFMSAGKDIKESKNFLYLLIVANVKNTHFLPLFKHLNVITTVFQDIMVYFFVYVNCYFLIKFAMWVFL